MRSSFRSVLVALVAVLAFGAVVASGASAFNLQWETKSGGAWKALGAGESRSVVLEGKSQVMSWNVLGGRVNIDCGKMQSKGKIKGGKPGTGEATEIKYTGCVVTVPENCEVKSVGNKAGSITIASLETELVTPESGVIDEKFSKSFPNGTLFELELGKEESEKQKFKRACGLLPLEHEKVTGSAAGKLTNGPGGNLGEAVVFTNPAQTGNNMSIGGNPFEWFSEQSQVLASGEGEALRVS